MSDDREMKWEYKQQVIGLYDWDGETEKKDEQRQANERYAYRKAQSGQEKYNELGEEGWELVNTILVHPLEGYDSWHLEENAEQIGFNKHLGKQLTVMAFFKRRKMSEDGPQSIFDE